MPDAVAALQQMQQTIDEPETKNVWRQNEILSPLFVPALRALRAYYPSTKKKEELIHFFFCVHAFLSVWHVHFSDCHLFLNSVMSCRRVVIPLSYAFGFRVGGEGS